MTELLYQMDSYVKEFSAVVTDLVPDLHGVILDQTIFYPGGGGQPYDIGELIQPDRVFSVTRMKRHAGSPVHVIQAENPLPEIDSQLSGKIDWDRRYQLMRTHTAMHILCGVVFRDYGALVTGGDMDPLKGRMDFEFESMHKDLVEEIEASINAEMHKGHEVAVRILPRQEAFQIPDLIRTKINLLPENIQQVRVVEIVGLDLQADGGTHVHNTAEVGPIRVVDYKSKGKINKRIYVELAE